MRSLLVILTALSVLFPVSAEDWVPVIAQAKRSIVKILVLSDGAKATCSGVVVSTGYIATMAHCVEEASDILADNREAKLLKSSALLDLAVLGFKDRGYIVMPLAPATPGAGTPIALLGYAGTTEILARFGHVSHQPLDNESMIDAVLIHGDSGGPVIDEQGRLLGLNSRIWPDPNGGHGQLSIVVPVETIRDYMEAYLPKAGQ